MNKVLICVILTTALFFALTSGQTRRCFSFTWLGPRYNNESVFMNATCDDATRMADGIPCFQPLVVSYDGSRPDFEYIWNNHADEASCLLADTDVCATYEYYFNGLVENATHMCTRVVDNMGNSINSGCFTQQNGSYITKVCFCRSLPGGPPCNYASTLHFQNLFGILVVVFALCFYNKEI